ncbi:DUF58 domain-containing protein [Flavobacteriaceae bacterium F08102]|nr:DUF58 domain-containing protein [Flavobacteriaceae bacterium F08102]
MLKSLYIHDRFYYYLSSLVGLFLLSYFIPALFDIAVLLLVLFGVLLFVDAISLYRLKNGIQGNRKLPLKFSNSDENSVPVKIVNHYPFPVFVKVIDELPFQFQKRDFEWNSKIAARSVSQFVYTLRPVERGEYHFGKLQVYTSSVLRILSRRFSLGEPEMVAVYPSYIQMRTYEFLAFTNKLNAAGLKKIRRLGHTMEFEQIKHYIPGDDVRTINWKATAKTGDLMINQYQDEKSQPIYCIIDTGRAMKMPFESLKLLDYAINATLAFANIALLKGDKSGLVTFAKKVDTMVAASSKRTHINVINEALYKVTTNFTDSDFGLLYATIKRKITHRSLLLLYTNFEHLSSLERQIPSLKAIAKQHLLVVVFFENTTLTELIQSPVTDIQAVYHQTIAEKFAYEKQRMVKELERNGIHALLTPPSKLSVNVINTYLRFKAKGLL